MRADLVAVPSAVECAAAAVSGGARSLRAVAAECGFESDAETAETLRDARQEGLVEWEPGRWSTLRAKAKRKTKA